MESIYYIGLDVHKKTISFCIKTTDGQVVGQGQVNAVRSSLGQWAQEIDRPWIGALEATMFTGWMYDFLKPYALGLKVAHPEMLKAITSAKKKNDRLDAEKICDLLRCDLLPESYMSSEKIRELRRILRFRNLMVREAVRMKNKTAGLLMEVGAPYNKKRLHGAKYFHDLLDSIEDVPDSVIQMLKLARAGMEVFTGIQKQLTSALVNHQEIRDRVKLLRSIAGVGEVTALTWVLEVGDPNRFRSVRQAISYCGLCSGQKESAGKNHRGPVSKKRNKHLQTILIEAANLAPRFNPELAEVYARELQRSHHNQAVIVVARKLAAFMLAVDRRQMNFIPKEIKAA